MSAIINFPPISRQDDFEASRAMWLEAPKAKRVYNVWIADFGVKRFTREGEAKAYILANVPAGQMPDNWTSFEFEYYDDKASGFIPSAVEVTCYVPQRDNPRFMEAPKESKKAGKSMMMDMNNIYSVLGEVSA